MILHSVTYRQQLLFFLVFCCTCLLLNSCGEDTCNEKYGDTFLAIEADTVFKDAAQSVQISLDTEVLAVLPESYFSAFDVVERTKDLYGKDWNNSWQLIDTLIVNTESITLTLKSEAVPAKNEVLPLGIHLGFPDRREYIDCDHPGSNDGYFLDIYLDLENIDDQTFRLRNFSWDEILNRGGH